MVTLFSLLKESCIKGWTDTIRQEIFTCEKYSSIYKILLCFVFDTSFIV